jgi:hypothetical protein
MTTDKAKVKITISGDNVRFVLANISETAQRKESNDIIIISNMNIEQTNLLVKHIFARLGIANVAANVRPIMEVVACQQVSIIATFFPFLLYY